MKILFLVPILFGAYSIKILLDERFEVDYVNELNATHEHESLKNKSCFRIFTCLNLRTEFNILANKAEINIDQLIVQLINYLNSTNFESDLFKDLKQRNLTIETWAYRRVLEINFLNPIMSKKFYIFNQNVCFLYTNLRSRDELISFGLIFSYFKDKNLILVKNNLSNYNILSMNDFFYFSFEEPKQLLVANKPYPYSNCKLLDERNNEKYSKFVCLNRCFRSKYRSLKYFYDANDTETIQLDLGLNKSISDHEKRCFDQCKRDDCELTTLVLSDKDYVFTAKPLLSDLNFYMQLIGLVLSFTNLSFYQLTLKVIKPNIKIKGLEKFNLVFDLLSNVLNRFQFSDRYKSALEVLMKGLVLVFCVLSFAYLSVRLYDEHQFKLKNPTRREITTNLIEPEPFKIVACAYVDNILVANHSTDPKTKLYLNQTFSDLEMKTDSGFNQTVDDIYIEFNSKKEKIHWELSSNVLFRFIPTGLLRCFEIKVYPREPKYRSLLSISKLIVEYKHQNALFFFLTENEIFHSKSFYFVKNSFRKKVILKSKTNEQNKCFNYDQMGYDCKDRSSCIEKYAIRALLQRYSKIAEGLVINKDYFNQKEWSSIRINGVIDHSDIPYDVYNQFYSNFSSPDCVKTIFENDLKLEPIDSRIELDIYYKQIMFTEDETTIYKLLFDLFALQGILFGLNVFDLFVIVSRFLRIKSKIWSTLYFATVYTVCGISFCVHVYLIFHQIINEELTKNQYYELTNSIEPQELRFCFDYDKVGLQKENLTANDLESLTSHMKVENVFKKIYYLNKSNQWIKLDKRSKFSNEELSIDTSYFLDKKCFAVKMNLTYEKNQFHFLQTTNIFKADFNSSFLSKHQNVFFLTKLKNKRQFSKLIKINNQNGFKYQVKQELFDIKQNDRFILIKDPLSLFSVQNYSRLNDPDIYLDKLIKDFKEKHNSTTLKLPLESEDFDLQINDTLFDQFQNRISTDKTHVNSNYERQFATNHLQVLPKAVTPNDSYFTFSFSFLKKKITISNAENYAKLILSLVNVVCLWFNFDLINALSSKTKLCRGSKLEKSLEDAAKKHADQQVNQMIGEINKQIAGEPNEADKNLENLKQIPKTNLDHNLDNEDKKKFADKQTQTCKQTITLKLNLESNELEFTNQVDLSNSPLDKNSNLVNQTDLHQSNQLYSSSNMKSTEL